MTGKPLEELVIGAARGEPMDVEELDRLRDALASSPRLEADWRAQKALTEQLGGLRGAIRVPEGGSAREQHLLDAFRAAHMRRAGSRRRLRLGVAAATVAACAAAILIATAIVETGPRPSAQLRGQAMTSDAESAPAQSSSPAVFHPLPFSPGVLPGRSYSVVRVRIPVSSFPGVYGEDASASVEADLLIGEDGIPSAIRFVQPDAIFVSARY